MKHYIGVLVSKAKPMTRKEYNDFRGWQVPENENPNDEGYFVERQDSQPQPELVGKANGYVSWLPKSVFEETYTMSSEDSRFYYAKAENGNLYIGDGKTLEEAKESAEDIEKSATLENGFDFGTAITLLKSGQKVAREGWNGKGMYLFLVKGECVTEVINDCYGDPNRYEPNAQGQESGTTLPVLDAIYMKTADNKLVPWLASQADMLSDDWCLV